MASVANDAVTGETFDDRYIRHPSLSLLHIVPGLVYLVLAPLQFVKRIRTRHLNFHRRQGRVLVACAGVSGVLALAINLTFPAFGGISTQSVTVFFGVLFLFSLTKAFSHIRRKEVALHREWMIRTFVLASGVASIRVFAGLFAAFSGMEFDEYFGTSFWLGFSTNLLIAETWINHTRRGRRRSVPSAARSTA